MLRALWGTAQGAEQSGTLLQAQSLGTCRRIDPGLRHGAPQLGFVVSRFQVIPQCLAFLRKGKFEESDEAISGYAQLFNLWCYVQPEHGGMYFGGRLKCFWRKCEELFHPGIQLC